jgi:predicted phosphodiesterase
MSHDNGSSTPLLIRETPEQRQNIFDNILINGQSLEDASWLQTDRLVNIKVPDGFRGIIYPDSHSPFEDAGVLRAIWEFCDYWQPHLAIDIGDFSNQDKLGRWAPNRKDGAPFSHQAEMVATRRQLREKATRGNPKKLIAIPGNHDDRVRQKDSDDAHAFSDLRNGRNHEALTDFVTNVLGFTEKDPFMFAWGIGQKGGREGGAMLNNLRVRHGNFVNPKPGYSAYMHWLKQLVSVVIGHVHRAGDFAVETASGETHCGAEVGHNLNALSPGANYMGPDNDWVRAFGVITCHNGVVNIQVVPFILGEDEYGRPREYATWVDLNHNIIEFAVQDS